MNKPQSLQELVETQKYYPIDKHIDCELTDTAYTVMEKRYLRGETPKELFQRVASAVCVPLHNHMGAEDVKTVETVFYNMLASFDFMPNSPTLMNAGRTFNQLAACFVVPVEDSMEGIFREAIADMAMIQRTGGGTGFDFSALRPKGAIVSSTMGESSGPIPFMRAFNACTDTVKQGGARRGANMGILRVDHPDIREFITIKMDPAEMTNFNLSVAVTDDFMKACVAGEEYELMHEGKVYGKEDAREIWDMIATRAWASGEPGVIFIDTINAKNTLPGLDDIAATNPCGEQPLLPYEACNLGSINLRNCVAEDGRVDYDKLNTVASLATFFLDCVIDAGDYPLPEITKMVQANRKIGLGVMGFADMCYMMEIGYGSTESVGVARNVMKNIDSSAKRTSELLAETFGSFPNLKHSVFPTAMRNAAHTTIAPTGTISLVCNASYGIEPFFALSYTKTLTDSGEEIGFINEHINTFMEKHQFDPILREVIESYVVANGTVQGVYDRFRHKAKNNAADLLLMQEVFVTAQDIVPVDHVHIQMAFQEFTDNAVSKTINFQNNVSPEDIQKIFVLAYQGGCKGITVYRDGCRDSQPLKVKKTIEASTEISAPLALKRPRQLEGITRQIPTGCGMMLVTVNMDEDGNVFEVLMRAGASGGCSAYTDAVARLVSIALRRGVPLDVLIDQLRSVRCDNFRYQAGKDPTLKGKSCPDAVGRLLQEVANKPTTTEATSQPETISVEELHNMLQQAIANPGTEETKEAVCPECKQPLLRAEGCLVCQCGYAKC